MLKNSSNLWNNELKYSKFFHSKGIPLLVDPHLLRKRKMGQIDLARLQKIKNEWLLEVVEMKSSNLGIEASKVYQSLRLKSTANFLSNIFNSKVILRYQI